MRTHLASTGASSRAPSINRRLIGGVDSQASGLHTGSLYQGGSEARAVGSYATIASAAFADQLLLSHTDFIVAASTPAVSGLSAFARAAANRANKQNVTLIRTDAEASVARRSQLDHDLLRKLCEPRDVDAEHGNLLLRPFWKLPGDSDAKEEL
jgi:hypothetical protein